MKRRDFVLAVVAAVSPVEIGRTALQKACYFVGVMLGREDLEYRPYYYGPFSEVVEDETSALVLSDLLNETRYDLGYVGSNGFPARRYVYSVTDEGRARLEAVETQYGDEVELVRSAVASIQEHLNKGLDVRVMSSAAKTYFIAKREGRRLKFDEISDIGRQLNWQLSDTEIRQVVAMLQSLGLFVAPQN